MSGSGSCPPCPSSLDQSDHTLTCKSWVSCSLPHFRVHLRISPRSSPHPPHLCYCHYVCVSCAANLPLWEYHTLLLYALHLLNWRPVLHHLEWRALPSFLLRPLSCWSLPSFWNIIHSYFMLCTFWTGALFTTILSGLHCQVSCWGPLAAEAAPASETLHLDAGPTQSHPAERPPCCQYAKAK